MLLLVFFTARTDSSSPGSGLIQSAVRLLVSILDYPAQTSLQADPISTYSFPHLGEVPWHDLAGGEQLEVQTQRQSAAAVAMSTHAGTNRFTPRGRLGKARMSQTARKGTTACILSSPFLEWLQFLFLLLLANALMHCMADNC